MFSESSTNISSKKPLLILLTGEKYSGKSTMATHLFKKHKFQVFHFAEPLKAAGEVFYGECDHFWEADLKENKHPNSQHSSRDIMLAIGDTIRRLDPTRQADVLVESIQAFRATNPDADVVVDDLRLIVEIDAVLAAFPEAVVIKMVAQDSEGNNEPTHDTEKGLPAKYISHIQNNDKSKYVTEELDFFIKELRA